MRISANSFQSIPADQVEYLEPVWKAVAAGGTDLTHFPAFDPGFVARALEEGPLGPGNLGSLASDAASLGAGIVGHGFSIESAGSLVTLAANAGETALEVDEKLLAAFGEPVAVLSVGSAALDVYRAVRAGDRLSTIVAGVDVCAKFATVVEMLAHVAPDHGTGAALTFVKFARAMLDERDRSRNVVTTTLYGPSVPARAFGVRPC